jgi:hypothetical protein
MIHEKQTPPPCGKVNWHDPLNLLLYTRLIPFGCASDMARLHNAHNAAVLGGYGTVPQFGTNVEVSQSVLPEQFYLCGTPKWDVGCETGPTDQFGDRKRRYCWLMLDNPGPGAQIMDDNSYAMKHETIFEWMLGAWNF